MKVTGRGVTALEVILKMTGRGAAAPEVMLRMTAVIVTVRSFVLTVTIRCLNRQGDVASVDVEQVRERKLR